MFLASSGIRRLAFLFSWSLKTRRHSSGLVPVRLRDYQEECIQSVLSYLKNGHKRLGISLATGSGKTVVFTQLIDRIKPPQKHATQTLILAHRRELVEQAARHCTNAYPNKSVDIELGKSQASGAADITVASIQSIMSKERLEKYDPKNFKLVLVDEAHHIVAPQYLDVLGHFGLRPLQEDAPALVGVSATFSRFDGIKLGTAIDHIVFHKDYVDMIGDGWLSDVLFTTVKLENADLSKVKTGANGDFSTGSLGRAINNEENREATVKSWLLRCSKRKSTIVFCVDVQHVVDLAAQFGRYNIEARYVTGTTSGKRRSETIDAFRNGEFPVLLNCGVFTEGTDIPNIDCVLLARPTQSRNLLIQMIGRGMRLSPGKENCHIIDMVSSLATGIVTTPTLYGLDPDEIVNEAKVEDLEKLRERQERENLARESRSSRAATEPARDPSAPPLRVKFTDYDTITDLLQDTSADRHIRALSRYAWVQVYEDNYILNNQAGGYLRLIREDGVFRVKHVAKLPPYAPAPYAKPRTIVDNVESFAHAVNAADAVAEKMFAFVFIDKNQGWRRGPATEAQVKFLNRFRAEDEQLVPEKVSKGRAMDMITKMKFGAKGRFQKLRKKSEKKVAETKKIEDMRLREQVSVGPTMR
ncbi:P-loop containing nucleoside triphosphate hydrolase protein [Microthyrium microscopicum]|uniref:P-loop containing nucleoside triphosphate hydrolase protein n=1 Tax=Microthyrium microscopicum TaxID=703497 RepID=A0A6A6U8N7_9PEZI|nr:P-loop containing nucleoside triphosphate hydrolase protein [Microthyrium microscopicum]